MFIAKSSLDLLQTYILRAFPEKGKSYNPELDCTELASAIFEGRTLLRLILSSRFPPEVYGKPSPLHVVMNACGETFRACFSAFYPSTPLKWFALCQQLQVVDPVCVYHNCHYVLIMFSWAWLDLCKTGGWGKPRRGGRNQP